MSLVLINMLSISLFNVCLGKVNSNISKTEVPTPIEEEDVSVPTALKLSPIQSMTFKKISENKFTCYLTFLKPINYSIVQLMVKGGGPNPTDYYSLTTLDSEIKSVQQGKGMEIKLDFNQISNRGVFAIYIYLADKNNIYFCTEPFVYSDGMKLPELERAHNSKTSTWVMVMIIVLCSLVGILIIAFIIRCLMSGRRED